MLRVVADTNVYISAIHRGGACEQILLLAGSGRITLCFSDAIMEEIHDVLKRKFRYSPAMLHRSTRRIGGMAARIVPHTSITACSDPDDNHILECAVASRADYLVTGDKALLDLHPFHHIPILRPREFLDLKPWEGS